MRNATLSWWTQVMQNRLIALVLAMVVLVPLVATPFGGKMPGSEVLAAEVFAIVLLTALLWKARWDLRREKIQAFLQTGVHLPVLLFLGLTTLSWLLSPQKALGAQQTLQVATGAILYFVVVYQFRRSEYLTKLVDTLLFVALAASLFGFVQYALGSGQFAVGPFYDHQLFGSFLMLLLPLVAMVAVTEKTPARQLVAQVTTVLTAAGLLLAHSRSAWVGAGAALLVLAVLAFWSAQRNSRRGVLIRKHEVVLPLMLIVTAVGFFLLISPETNSILSRATTFGQLDKDSTWKGRHPAWQGALAMIRAKPLTGFGTGSYPYFQARYSGVGADLAVISKKVSLAEEAHNFYLQTAVELGLPGLIVMVSLLVGFYVLALRRLKEMESGVRRNLLIGCMAALVGFSVDAFSSPSWQMGQVSLFFWLALGMGVNCLLPKPKHAEAEPVVALPPVMSRSMTVVASLALTALLPTIQASAAACYSIPVSADIQPKNASIIGGQFKKYTLNVTFNCGGNLTTTDVSTSPNTHFSQTGGVGQMVQQNNRFYQSRYQENDNPLIMALYSDSNGTVSDSTPLNVHYP